MSLLPPTPVSLIAAFKKKTLLTVCCLIFNKVHKAVCAFFINMELQRFYCQGLEGTHSSAGDTFPSIFSQFNQRAPNAHRSTGWWRSGCGTCQRAASFYFFFNLNCKKCLNLACLLLQCEHERDGYVQKCKSLQPGPWFRQWQVI